MSSLVALIQNENMKIYRRVATWVMVGLLILLVIAFGFLTRIFMNDTVDENWKQTLTERNESLEEMVADPYFFGPKNQFQNDIMINQYRIENDIEPTELATFWGFVKEAVGVTSIITMFTIIVGAGIVANEFSWGTIKLLLIRPVSRGKVLLSKYLSTFGFALFLLFLLFVFSLLVSGLLFGFTTISQPHLVVDNGMVVEKNMVVHILFLYLLRSVDLLMMVTFAFMISTVFRSSSLAVGLALFLMFTGTQVVMIFSQYDWVKYVLFANTYLAQHIEGTQLVEGMTMQFSLIVLAIYFFIFNFLSWFGFKKRDVAT